MQKIFENEFVTTYFDANTQMAKNIWKEQSQDLTDIQFKDLFSRLQPTIFSYAATRLMIDVRLFKFVIEPDLQEWTTEYVLVNYAKNGVTKIATILPSSIFERVSLQQTFNEETVKKHLKRKQFDDEQRAQEWLLA